MSLPSSEQMLPRNAVEVLVPVEDGSNHLLVYRIQSRQWCSIFNHVTYAVCSTCLFSYGGSELVTGLKGFRSHHETPPHQLAEVEPHVCSMFRIPCLLMSFES